MQESVWRWQRSVKYSLPLSRPHPPPTPLLHPTSWSFYPRQNLFGEKSALTEFNQPTNQTKSNSQISFIVISFQRQNEVKPGCEIAATEPIVIEWIAEAGSDVRGWRNMHWQPWPDGGGGGMMRAVVGWGGGSSARDSVCMHACFCVYVSVVYM